MPLLLGLHIETCTAPLTVIVNGVVRPNATSIQRSSATLELNTLSQLPPCQRVQRDHLAQLCMQEEASQRTYEQAC